jgi:glycosyltransferase involved in cell wall biosynthesis
MQKVIGIVSFMNTAGAQEALLRLARQLRVRGYDAEVWFLYEEVPVYHGEPFTRTFLRKAKPSLWDYASIFFRVIKTLRQEKPDAVIGFLPLGNVLGLTAALLAGVDVRIASQRAPGPTFGRVMRTLDRILGSIGVYTSVVCVSDAVRRSFDGYGRRYRNLLSVVHNGIEWRGSELDKADARRRLRLPPGEFTYVALGRMKRQKNYPFLLDAFSSTDRGCLVIAGDGELRKALEQQAENLQLSNRLILLGNISREETRHLLRASDAFVQASLYEGQSNAVLEAMHEALPILVNDIPEQRETIVDDDTGESAGLLATVDDKTMWVRLLQQLRDDADLRQKLSSSAQHMVARRFTLDRMIDGFEHTLKNRRRPMAPFWRSVFGP